MIISKSDYIKYYQCPKCLWLYKNRKDLILGDLEEQMAGAIANGEEVEKQAYGLFSDGVMVPNDGFKKSIDNTIKAISVPVLGLKF